MHLAEALVSFSIPPSRAENENAGQCAFKGFRIVYEMNTVTADTTRVSPPSRQLIALQKLTKTRVVRR